MQIHASSTRRRTGSGTDSLGGEAVEQPVPARANQVLLAAASAVLPPLSVGKMTLRLYGALNYSHGLSKGPSFGTGRGRVRGYRGRDG